MEVLVLYDYTAVEVDELSIKKGDIIKEVNEFENGWFIGQLNGQIGVFPDNFVKKIGPSQKSESTLQSSVDANELSAQKMNHSSRNEYNNDIELMNSKPQKRVVGIGLGNIFSGQPIQLRQTALKDVFKETEASGDKGPLMNQATVPSGHVVTSQPNDDRVVVRFDYQPCEPDELELRVDDIIVILDRDIADEGWWRGHNLRTNKTGVFPDNFVAPVSDIHSPTSQAATRSMQGPEKAQNPALTPASGLSTQVGIVSAPLAGGSTVDPTKAGTRAATHKIDGAGPPVMVTRDAMPSTVETNAPTPPQPPPPATTTTTAIAEGTTTSSVASKASLFGERVVRRKTPPSGCQPANAVSRTWKSRPTSTGLTNAATGKDAALAVAQKPGSEDHATTNVTTNFAPSNSPMTGTFYTANRPRQAGRRLPKKLAELNGQAATSTCSAQAKGDLVPRPCSVPGSAQVTSAPDVNHSRVVTKSASRDTATPRPGDGAAETSRAGSGDLNKSGNPAEAGQQPDITSSSASRQAVSADTRRSQVADAQLQQKLEELTALYTNHVKQNKQEMQELCRQIDVLKESNAQLSSDLSQSQCRLTMRLQTLMDELDETKKQRASDAIELARLRRLCMQLDAKSLTGQTGDFAQSRGEEQSRCWQQELDHGAKTHPDLTHDNCAERANSYSHLLRQTRAQPGSGGSHSGKPTQATMGFGEAAGEDNSQTTPTDPEVNGRGGSARPAPTIQPRPVSLSNHSRA